jgi:hypothetical protein
VSTTGLNFALAANTTYSFDYYILFQTSAAIRGISLALTGPAATIVSYTVSIPEGGDGTGAMMHGWGTAWDDEVLAAAVPAADTTYVARVVGVVRTGASGGTLTPRFRSEASVATARVMNYSWGSLSTP